MGQNDTKVRLCCTLSGLDSGHRGMGISWNGVQLRFVQSLSAGKWRVKTPSCFFVFLVWMERWVSPPWCFRKSLPKGFAEALTSNWDVEKSKRFGQLFFQCSKKSIEILHTDWLYLSSGGTHPAFNNDSSILIHPFCQLSSIFMIQWSTESPLYNPLVGDELE